MNALALQATIPLDALRAELCRRLEMIRRQRPFPGKSIGTFGGPAQALAIDIDIGETTMKPKVEISPGEVGEATTEHRHPLLGVMPPLYVSLDKLEALTTLSTSTIQSMVARNEFPAPRVLSSRRVGWLYREVMEWAENRPVSNVLPPPNTGAKKPRTRSFGVDIYAKNERKEHGDTGQ